MSNKLRQTIRSIVKEAIGDDMPSQNQQDRDKVLRLTDAISDKSFQIVHHMDKAKSDRPYDDMDKLATEIEGLCRVLKRTIAKQKDDQFK